jgi:TonB-linked SusC/RagA family outer membrane protein
MKKITLLIAVLLFSTTAVFAQVQVKGKVTDSRDGSPIPSASVKITGTDRGVSTNADGSFSIDVPKSDATLEISAVGFSGKTVKAQSGQDLSIRLGGEIKNLNEVVVTGVGVATSKKKVAIDVASVNAKDFSKSSTASIEQSIMGQVAGAQIQQASGQPNSGYSIILRGINSLGGTNPMILLDGIEINDLSNIDPVSIDRVEIVKGAAAGTLYGAQGANGVIQLFSKKGQKGKMNIRVSTKYNWDNILRGHDVIAKFHHYETDAQGYILDNGGVNRIVPNEVGEWPDPTEDLSLDSKNDKPYLEPVYDHVSQSYRRALTQSTSVSISGGAEKVDYAFTASYLNQQDVYENKFKRLNLNLNLGLELFKGFTLRSNTQGFVSEDNTLTNPNSRFGLVNNFAFIDFLHRDSIGNLVMKVRNENQRNPLSEAEWHSNTTKPISIVQNFDVNYKFPRYVTLNYKIGITKTFTDGLDYYKNQTGALQTDLPWGNTLEGSVAQYNFKQTFVNSLASIYVNTDFEKDFNAGIPLKTVTQFSYDYRKDDLSFYGAQGSGLPGYPPYNISVASSTIGTANPAQFLFTQIPGTFVTYGYLINQTFDYGNLFGISGGLRSDYSSEFGAASKPFTFYRGTVYFRPSELLQRDFIADWKLRAAYGEAGIQPGRYQRQVTFNVAQLGNAVAIYLPTTAQNPDLQVQVSKELEVGTDITFRRSNASWLNRISLSGTYWKRKSTGIIQNADVSVSSGFLNRTDNLSTISSKGLDLTVDATVLEKNNLTWNFAYRMGFAKSIVDKIAGGKDVIAGEFALKEGQEVGSLYGQYAITSFNDKDAAGNPYISEADQKYYTSVNGIMVDTRTNKPIISAANDQKAFGSVYPKFTASFINNFTLFKTLNISFQFDWYHGNKIYNLSRQWLYRDRISSDFDNSVTIGSKSGAFVNYYTGFYNSVSPDNWFVEDGSFVRLRNASITYDFAPLIKLKWFKSAELTLAGRNLWTHSKYTGLDPENTTAVDLQGNDVSTQVGGFKGVDYFGVPNTRSYQVGLTLGF